MRLPRGVLIPALVALFASTAWGFSRYLDGFLTVFLRQQTGMGLIEALVRNARLSDALGAFGLYVPLGLVVWLAFAGAVYWVGRESPYEVNPFEEGARSLLVLAIPIGLTLLACLSLLASPVFPYGLNLALTLALEGPFSAVLTALLFGAVLFHVLHRLREPEEAYEDPPSLLESRIYRAAIVVVATVVFAALTPSWFWKDGEGQGNTLKYLRMAATFAGSGTLDVARAESGAGATLAGFLGQLPAVTARYASESQRLLAGFQEVIRARQIYIGTNTAETANRAMFRSAAGGIYYINAPGPGLLLVPAYLADRALNRSRGTDRQSAVMVFWSFLGALLLLQMILAARELTARDGPAVAAGLFLCASPPVLLYTHHIYPELPAALCLLFVFRKLLMDAAPGLFSVLAASFALGALPWLHQKFSVTAAILALTALLRLARMNALARLPRVFFLFLPLAFSAFAFTVYNHALTGSVLPDATFRAAGRVAFQPEGIPVGVLGLLFDAENGLFVYAPIYLLALAAFGALLARSENRTFYWLVIVVPYVLVIASFPYWPGAVSAVGRYLLTVAPLAALPLALLLERAAADGRLSGIVATLSAVGAAFSVSFYKDTIPAYETHLLLERTLFSDPRQYLPSFLNEVDPGRYEKLIAVLVVTAILFLIVRSRLGRELLRFDETAWRGVPGGAAIVFLVLLSSAFVLEQLPQNKTSKSGPVFRDTGKAGLLDVSASGAPEFENDRLFLPAGASSRLLVRTTAAAATLRVTLTGGESSVRTRLLGQRAGQRAVDVDLSPGERKETALPLGRAYVFEGPKGSAFFYTVTAEVESSSSEGRRGVFIELGS